MAERNPPVVGPNDIPGHWSNLVALEDRKQTAELRGVFVFPLPRSLVLISLCQLDTSCRHLGRENILHQFGL